MKLINYETCWISSSTFVMQHVFNLNRCWTLVEIDNIMSEYRVKWKRKSTILYVTLIINHSMFSIRIRFSYLCITYWQKWILNAIFFLQAIWAFNVYDYEAPKYNKQEYPDWAIILGWCIAATSLIPIPLFAITQVVRAKSNCFIGVRRFFSRTVITKQTIFESLGILKE